MAYILAVCTGEVTGRSHWNKHFSMGCWLWKNNIHFFTKVDTFLSLIINSGRHSLYNTTIASKRASLSSRGTFLPVFPLSSCCSLVIRLDTDSDMFLCQQTISTAINTSDNSQIQIKTKGKIAHFRDVSMILLLNFDKTVIARESHRSGCKLIYLKLWLADFSSLTIWLVEDC